MPVGQFIFILRSRLHLSPGTSLFVFVNNTLPQTVQLMGSVYESHTKMRAMASFTCATAARRHSADQLLRGNLLFCMRMGCSIIKMHEICFLACVCVARS